MAERPLDKPISEWQRRLRGMSPDKLTDAWSAKAEVELTWTQEANFHVAAAERMKQLGNMAIDLDDATRLKLCRKANDILARLQAHLRDRPEHLAEIAGVIAHSNAYHSAFGTRTARYYMYEQGVIDILGDRSDAA